MVLFVNAGIIHHVGPNRLYVRAARRLAAAGITSLRFDLSGIGDSPVEGRDSSSILERVERDIADALDQLSSLGADSVVLVGLCSGADIAFHIAGKDLRVSGAILLDPSAYRTASFYVHHYGRRLLRLESWRNLVSGPRSLVNRVRGLSGSEAPAVQADAPAASAPTRDDTRQQLTDLIRRRVQLLYIFTGGLEARYNHRDQLFRAFPGLDWQGCAQLEYYGHADHTFSKPADQDLVIQRMVNWLGDASFAS